MIDNNPGVVGFPLTVNYDPDVLTLCSFNKTSLTNLQKALCVNSNDNGTIKIIWNNIEDITGNGALFKLTFSATEGDFPRHI